MRDKIPKMPNDGETLLKDLKLTRPMDRDFGEYWNVRGQEQALTLDLTEVEARHLRAARVPEKELLGGEAPGASVGGAGMSAGPTAADETLAEPHGWADGRSDTARSRGPRCHASLCLCGSLFWSLCSRSRAVLCSRSRVIQPLATLRGSSENDAFGGGARHAVLCQLSRKGKVKIVEARNFFSFIPSVTLIRGIS